MSASVAAVETFAAELAVLCSVMLLFEADVLSVSETVGCVSCELHMLASGVLLDESAAVVASEALVCRRATRARRSTNVRVMREIRKWAIRA